VVEYPSDSKDSWENPPKALQIPIPLHSGIGGKGKDEMSRGIGIFKKRGPIKFNLFTHLASKKPF